MSKYIVDLWLDGVPESEQARACMSLIREALNYSTRSITVYNGKLNVRRYNMMRHVASKRHYTYKRRGYWKVAGTIRRVAANEFFYNHTLAEWLIRLLPR